MVTGPSAGVFVVGAEAFVNSGTTNDVVVSGISISNNLIRSTDEYKCSFAGVLVWAGFIEGAPGTVNGIRVQDVNVADNRISGCRRGISLSGAGVQAPNFGLVKSNAVQRVAVTKNTLTNNLVGIQIAGATASDNDYSNAVRTPTSGTATYDSNRVDSVFLTRNRVIGGTTGLRFVGADSEYTTGFSLTKQPGPKHLHVEELDHGDQRRPVRCSTSAAIMPRTP